MSQPSSRALSRPRRNLSRKAKASGAESGHTVAGTVSYPSRSKARTRSKPSTTTNRAPSVTTTTEGPSVWLACAIARASPRRSREMSVP